MGGKGKVWWWIVVALFLLAFLWFVPQLQGRYLSQGVPAEEIPALVNEYRRTWAQILGGAALLSGIYFTWRTLQVNREGQITERFTRAIDQLGKVEDGQKLFEIRVGSIYALERIARESEEDHWPIMEVLTAYVRQHARRRLRDVQDGSERATIAELGEDSSGEPEADQILAHAPDIQAINTVLRRRTHFYGYGEPEPLNLSNASLSYADFRGANLSHARLRGTDLTKAFLWRTDLSRARLRGADLTDAQLTEADLTGADLIGADLIGANLEGANLQGARVTDEQLADTQSLQGAIMPDGQKYEDWLKDREKRQQDE